MCDKKLNIYKTYRPLWGLGMVKRRYSWEFTPAESMTEQDLLRIAQSFIRHGAEVNLVDR
jgi:hypothetical protein